MTSSTYYGRIVPALLLLIILAVPAAAYPADPEEQKPCMEELDKFCKDVKPGEGRVILCLMEHDKDLSTVCRNKVQVVVKRLEEAKLACAPDIGKFCADVKPGGGRLIKCLKPHIDELTPACREKGGFVLKGPGGKSTPSPGTEPASESRQP